MTRTADRSPRGYAFTGAEHDAAQAEVWSISPTQVGELLKPHGWTLDAGGTTVLLHRKTLTRLSIDLDFWPSALRSITQAALVIARADAEARAKGKERPVAENPGGRTMRRPWAPFVRGDGENAEESVPAYSASPAPIAVPAEAAHAGIG